MLIHVLPALSQLNGLLICIVLLFVDLNHALLSIQPSPRTFLQWSLYLTWIWHFSYFYLSECFPLVWQNFYQESFAFRVWPTTFLCILPTKTFRNSENHILGRYVLLAQKTCLEMFESTWKEYIMTGSARHFLNTHSCFCLFKDLVWRLARTCVFMCVCVCNVR